MVARLPAPTTSLPPLKCLPTYSLIQITEAIKTLRAIYCPPALKSLPTARALPKHLVHDNSVPDSGYASAEEDDDEDVSYYDPDILRSDKVERDFAIHWLTAFTARSDKWVGASECSGDEAARAALVDNAAALLGLFAGGDAEEVAVARSFTFSTRSGQDVCVELNDAPLLSDDHTSVGLQSWGSSIRLGERICLDPADYGLAWSDRRLRVLELGAGTGLLSIAVAKLLATPRLSMDATVVATDYHPSVLDNLRGNVGRNSQSSPCGVDVLPLDWQYPKYDGPLADRFNIILAADVIYHPDHARWIKGCVQRLLARPIGVQLDGEQERGGFFWLIVPLRPRGGRHEGMSQSVEAVFRRADKVPATERQDLVILSIEDLSKQVGVGRADEGGYKLYKIGWL